MELELRLLQALEFYPPSKLKGFAIVLSYLFVGPWGLA